MTAAAVPHTEKRKFPRCPSCGWANALQRYTEGIAVLERLAQLAATVGRHLSRQEFDTPIADYKCKKCRAIVVIRIGDLLRN